MENIVRRCKENCCKAAFTTKQCLQFHYKKVHGLTEEMMPKIERSVAYTFDAYSGGLVEDAGRGKTPRLSRRNSQVCMIHICNNICEIFGNVRNIYSYSRIIATVYHPWTIVVRKVA